MLRLSQVIASFSNACKYFGFMSRYTRLECVACNQLEELRAALLEIEQIDVISVKKFGEEVEQLRSEVHVHNSEQIFIRMQKQLNYCIRHHQQIRRHGFKTNYWTKHVFLLGTLSVYDLPSHFLSDTCKYQKIQWMFLCVFVWSDANILISNVFWDPLHHHGKVFVSDSYGNRLLYSKGNAWVHLISFSNKQNRYINIKITYHYNRDANTSLGGKLWICNMTCISIIRPDNPILQLKICNLNFFFLGYEFFLISEGQ